DQMALAPALGPIGGIRTGLITDVHRAYGTTAHDGPRPINLVVACEPIQEREVDQVPHTRPLPIAQAPPARHPRPAPEFLREHLPGNTAAQDENNTGEARAIRITHGRPPCGRRGGIGRSGSTRSHNASGSSEAAIPVHATLRTRIRFPRVKPG